MPLERLGQALNMKETMLEQWNAILDYMKEEYKITEISYKTWLMPLQVYDVKNNKVIIDVDDQKIGPRNIAFLQEKYGLFLQTAICEVLGIDSIGVEFASHSSLLEKEKEMKTFSSNQFSQTKTESTLLNTHYTFDTFIVGPNNSFAHAASLAVAESPGTVYNPLFIYGGVGLGKTHLMHSIAHFIISNNPTYKVLYVTSETFTNDVIQAIRHEKLTPADLRQKYRTLDVLLIDDIQFIIGKESTQEEFFHTFNVLYEAKKQIIISSDKPPKDIQTLEDRLRSRFEWGLTVDISLPDYETRMAILKKKCEMEGREINETILDYVASNIKSSIRDLEGALTKVIAISRLQKREISLSLAEEALKDNISPDQKKLISPEYIVSVVEDHFELPQNSIYSNSRERKYASPRHIVMFLCRRLTGMSLEAIGEKLGNRDHSTVLHGCNKVEERIATDIQLKQTIDVLIKKINP